MAIKIGPCPKCGNTTFIATAHVTQTPDAEDLFTCSKCGEEVTAINV